MSKKDLSDRADPGSEAAEAPAAAKPTRRKRTPAAAADNAGKAAGTRTKPAAKPRPAKAKTMALAAPADSIAPAVSVDLRRAMIARAAYFRAERRDFASGGETQDWLEAEQEVDLLLLSGKRPTT